MAIATISSILSLLSVVAVGVNYFKYTNVDPESPIADAPNVKTFIFDYFSV